MPAAPGGADKTRDLTENGLRQAREVREALKAEKVDRVLCSPAVRAVNTMTHATGLQTSDAIVSIEKDLYEASTETYLVAIRNLDAPVECALFIGHNPGISATASWLADNAVSMSPASWVIIDFETASWPEIARNGRIRFHYSPPTPKH